MKKILLGLMLPCMASVLYAQEYLFVERFWEKGEIIPLEQIESITFGDFEAELLPELMEKDDNIKLFNQALTLTGLRDSLYGIFDNDFYYDEDVVSSYFTHEDAYAMQKLRKGYTAFVETDKTYALYDIHTIEDLKAYAAEVYDDMYPEDAAVTDPTDRRNSLNRFVAYHLLDRRATQSSLTAAGISNKYAGDVASKYNRSKIDIADWYETMMPHSLLKCSAPSMHPNGVYVNRRGLQDHADERGVLVEGAQLVNETTSDYQGEAYNGYYHYISDIIAYDKQTQEVVLDEQIIINNSTLSPEFMNNGLRIDNPFPQINSGNAVFLPKGALKNVQSNNDDTRMFYLFNQSWHNMQTDEFIITGPLDVSFKLPPLPAGTYEICLGYTASELRHVVTSYLDGEFCDTLDLRVLSYQIGWESDRDLSSSEAIVENDRLLFEQGYRKGLPYCYIYDGRTLMRDNSLCLRRIITTLTTDGRSDHYLRFKNANEMGDGRSQFMIDFIELCPTHLLPEYE